MLQWETSASHRGSAVNVVLLVALLWMIGSAALLAAAGSACLLWLAVRGLSRAARATWRHPGRTLLLDRLSIWLPGAAALVLAALGLHLAATSDAGSPTHAAGMVLFGFETIMLLLPGDAPVRLTRAQA